MHEADWVGLFKLHAERDWLRLNEDGPRHYLDFTFDHPKGTVLEHRGL